MAGSVTRINTVASSTATTVAAPGSGSGGGSPGGPVAVLSRNRSLSKHSLLDVVSSRIVSSSGGGAGATEGGGGNAGGTASSSGLKGKRFSRESFSAACVNKVPVLPSHPPQSLSKAEDETATTELIPRRSRDARRRDLKKRWEAGRLESAAVAGASSTTNPGGGGAGAGRSGCKWTFVFDPAGRLCYYWSLVVSLAFLYNFWVLIYRFAFQVRPSVRPAGIMPRRSCLLIDRYIRKNNNDKRRGRKKKKMKEINKGAVFTRGGGIQPPSYEGETNKPSMTGHYPI